MGYIGEVASSAWVDRRLFVVPALTFDQCEQRCRLTRRSKMKAEIAHPVPHRLVGLPSLSRRQSQAQARGGSLLPDIPIGNPRVCGARGCPQLFSQALLSN